MANDTQIVFTARDDTRGAIESVARGLGSIKSAADGMESAISNLGGLKALLGVTFAGFSVNTFVDGVNSAIHSLAELDDAAERTGASVEKLTALKGVAKIGDFDFSQVEEGLVRLAKALSGADDEAKAAGHAIATLKLDPDKLRAMDAAEALKAVADALAQYRDGAGKTALAQDLLGKSGAKLLPYLKDLAEVGELVGRSTGEQAAQAEQYEKNVKRLNAGFDAWKKTAANALLPALVEITDEMVKARKEGGLLYSVLIGLGGLGLKIAGVDLDPLKRAEKEANEAFTRLAQGRKALADLDKKGDTGEYGGFLGKLVKSADRARLESYIKDQEEVLKKATAVKKALAGMGHGESEGDKPTLDYKGRDPKDSDPKTPKSPAYNGLYDNLDHISKWLARDMAEIQQMQEHFAALEAATVGPIEAQAEALEKQADAFGKTDVAIEQTTIARLQDQRAVAASVGAFDGYLTNLDAQIAAHKRLADAMASVKWNQAWAKTPQGGLDAMIDQIQAITEAGQRLGKTQDEIDAAIIANMADQRKAIESTKSAAEELGITFSSAFEEAMVGGKSFKDILSGLEKDLIRIFARKVVTEPLAEVATNFFKPEGEQSHKALDASGDFMGKLKSGAKSLWESFFGTSDAAKGLSKAAGDSAAKVAESAVESTAASSALSALTSSATQAAAALSSLSGKSGGSSLMSVFGSDAGNYDASTWGSIGQSSPDYAGVDWSEFFADGGIMSGKGRLPLNTYAFGGIATSPQMAVFGEGSMNEAYVPLPDGHRIPVNLNNAGSRQTVVNMQVVTPDTNSFRASKGQIVAEMSRAMAAGQRYL